jgi:hypothetical protein
VHTPRVSRDAWSMRLGEFESAAGQREVATNRYEGNWRFPQK